MSNLPHLAGGNEGPMVDSEFDRLMREHDQRMKAVAEVVDAMNGIYTRRVPKEPST